MANGVCTRQKKNNCKYQMIIRLDRVKYYLFICIMNINWNSEFYLYNYFACRFNCADRVSQCVLNKIGFLWTIYQKNSADNVKLQRIKLKGILWWWEYEAFTLCSSPKMTVNKLLKTFFVEFLTLNVVCRPMYEMIRLHYFNKLKKKKWLTCVT